jgi:hypothetical protein
MWNVLKYVKLIELAMVYIIGSTKDERCLVIVAFMKSNFCNTFITHLPWVVCILCACLHIDYTLCKISHM